MHNTSQSTFSKIILAFWAGCGFLMLWATSASAVEMPAGERIVEMGWHQSESMILLVEEGHSYALRRLELGTGEISVIEAPRAFTSLSLEDDSDVELDIALAPSGLALAVLEKYGSPLNPPDLSVYAIAGDELELLSTAKMPHDFLPELMAWSTDGGLLYLSSRHYLLPEQPYSIGVFDTASERFSGVALKANVDLISSMEFIPGRRALVVSCRGFHGEYPDQQMIVLINADGVATVIHSQADSNQFHVLASGAVLVYTDKWEEDANSDELWLLDPSAEQLRRANYVFNGPVNKSQTSTDGLWMGLLVSAADLDLHESGAGEFLVLQRGTDGKTVITAEACLAFAFSPTGEQVCTVSVDGSSIGFYNLPE